MRRPAAVAQGVMPPQGLQGLQLGLQGSRLTTPRLNAEKHIAVEKYTAVLQRFSDILPSKLGREHAP